MKAKQLALIALCGTLTLSGCASMNIAPENQNTAKGAAIGAGVGAVLGKATGNHKNKRLAIGAAIGALAGAAVGRYMDNQEQALREQLSGTGVKVYRDGNTVIYRLRERPTINTIEFDGNKDIKEEQLNESLAGNSVEVGEPLDKTILKSIDCWLMPNAVAARVKLR